MGQEASWAARSDRPIINALGSTLATPADKVHGMIYSSACAHAIRALSQLAMVSPEGYVLLDDLCQQGDLPRHFVAKVFQSLVRGGILESARGRGGGFALARPAREIALWDIVAVVDGVDEVDKCVVGIARCDDRQPCPQHDQWKPIRSQIKRYLKETTLAQMSRALEKKLERIGGETRDSRHKSPRSGPRRTRR